MISVRFLDIMLTFKYVAFIRAPITFFRLYTALADGLSELMFRRPIKILESARGCSSIDMNVQIGGRSNFIFTKNQSHY